MQEQHNIMFACMNGLIMFRLICPNLFIIFSYNKLLLFFYKCNFNLWWTLERRLMHISVGNKYTVYEYEKDMCTDSSRNAVKPTSVTVSIFGY